MIGKNTLFLIMVYRMSVEDFFNGGFQDDDDDLDKVWI